MKNLIYQCWAGELRDAGVVDEHVDAPEVGEHLEEERGENEKGRKKDNSWVVHGYIMSGS